MGIRNWRNDRSLERRLRAKRLSAREELVGMLASGVSVRRPSPLRNRGSLARVAVILAVTTAIAASLGVTGAIGYARHSVGRFGTDVEHIFSPPGPQSSSSNSGDEATKGGIRSNYNDGDDGNGDPFKDPFDFVYGTLLAICDPNHNLQFVSVFDWFTYIVMPGYSFSKFDSAAQSFYCGPST